MESVLQEKLSERIGVAEIRELCRSASGSGNNSTKQLMFSLIADNNDRVGYNVLWIFTNFSGGDKIWMN